MCKVKIDIELNKKTESSSWYQVENRAQLFSSLSGAFVAVPNVPAVLPSLSLESEQYIILTDRRATKLYQE